MELCARCREVILKDDEFIIADPTVKRNYIYGDKNNVHGRTANNLKYHKYCFKIEEKKHKRNMVIITSILVIISIIGIIVMCILLKK